MFAQAFGWITAVGLTTIASALGGVMVPPQGSAQGTQDAASPAPTFNYTARIRPTTGLRHSTSYDRRLGIILFEARVNGRNVVALLDNRTERSLISAALAETLKLELKPSRITVRTTLGQTAVRGIAAGVSVVIPGQIEIESAFFVFDLAAMSQWVGHQVDLVLGNEFFQELGFSVVPMNGTFSVGRGGSQRPMESYRSVPLLNARPQVAVEIGGKRYVLTVDLGYDGGVKLRPDQLAAAAPGEPERRSSIMDIAGREEVSRQRRTTIRIGEVDIPNVPVSDGSINEEDGDGLIGMAVLGRAPFVLDIKDRTLWLGRRVAVPPPTATPTPPASPGPNPTPTPAAR